MTNAERIAAHITQNGADNLLIHTIPGTQFWLLAEKIGKDLWSLTLLNPMKSVKYQIGLVHEKDHLKLWMELTGLEISRAAEAVKLAKQIKTKIQNFLSNSSRETYKNLLATIVLPDVKPKKSKRRGHGNARKTKTKQK